MVIAFPSGIHVNSHGGCQKNNLVEVARFCNKDLLKLQIVDGRAAHLLRVGFVVVGEAEFFSAPVTHNVL